nr:adenosylcobinamide amidohydrolase [Streptomyces sp. NBC_00830]
MPTVVLLCHRECSIRSVRVRPPGQRVELLARQEDGLALHHLVRRLGPGWRVCSSAVLGGGIGPRAWILNAQVPGGYPRFDPDAHLAAIAAAEDLTGPGAALMAAADVTAYTVAADEGVTASATSGLGVRGWAVDPAAGTDGPSPPGTINIVGTVPVALSDAALVNAVAAATEAKVQALLDGRARLLRHPHGRRVHRRTRTRSGAAAQPFAGPRWRWGSRLARALHGAVLDGALRQP